MLKSSALGNVFVVSAASGTGKTTLVSRLIHTDPRVRVAVSHTTRQPRSGETDGEHYHFVSRELFETMIGEGAFLEHADVYGNYYGTSTAAVETLRQQGLDVILEIDIQGAAQIRALFPQVISIFILPPSMAVLEERLVNRATDSAEVIALRMAHARAEIEQALLFDYVVVNEDIVHASQELLHIIHAQRLTQAAQQDKIVAVLGNRAPDPFTHVLPPLKT